MKFKKQTAAIIAGFLCIFPLISIAQPLIVQSYLRQDYKLELNGEDILYPEGLSPMIYQNRTYLPLSFLAQILGADINFNQANNVISIVSQDKSMEYEEKIIEYQNEINELNNKIDQLKAEINNEEKISLSRFPIRRIKDGYELEIEGLSIGESGDGRLYITLKNNDSNAGVYMSILETTVTIDGKIYKPQSTFNSNINMDFYNWMSRGQSISSYIPFINLPRESDIRDLKIEVKIVTNQIDPKTETFVFEATMD